MITNYVGGYVTHNIIGWKLEEKGVVVSKFAFLQENCFSNCLAEIVSNYSRRNVYHKA